MHRVETAARVPGEWAARVFPELGVEQAQRRLARELLSFCRLGPGDPPGHKGWTQHLATLRRRAARLTKLDLKEVQVAFLVLDGDMVRCLNNLHSLVKRLRKQRT